MAGKDNLIGKGFDSKSAEEARESGRKGGIASGKARREKRQLRELLDMLMERNAGKDSDGNPITAAEAMAIKAVKEAMAGDWKAWELVRDTSGQKPIEKVMLAEVEQSVIDEVEAAVFEDDEGTGN